jgi:hypothetical protein
VVRGPRASSGRGPTRPGGEQAGRRARWAQRLRKYTSTVSETDIRTKVEEAAGKAGRAAAREAAEQASHDAAGGPGTAGR